MDHKGYPTKSGYLNYEPCGFYITIWIPSVVSGSDTSNNPRVQSGLDPRQGPTCYPSNSVEESHPTRDTNRVGQILRRGDSNPTRVPETINPISSTVKYQDPYSNKPPI